MWRQSDNSLSQIHHKRTEKERLIAIIERNLKKIKHLYILRYKYTETMTVSFYTFKQTK